MDALTTTYGRFDGSAPAINPLEPKAGDLKDVSAVRQVDKPLRMEGRPLPRNIQDEPVVAEVMKQMFEDHHNIALVTIRLEAPGTAERENASRVDVLA
jgi:hypothetical protein